MPQPPIEEFQKELDKFFRKIDGKPFVRTIPQLDLPKNKLKKPVPKFLKGEITIRRDPSDFHHKNFQRIPKNFFILIFN